MARYFVPHQNKWACYDTAECDFLTKFEDKQTIQRWCDREHELAKMESMPIERQQRCLYGVATNMFHEKGYLHTIVRLALAGVDGDEIDRLIDMMRGKEDV